MAPASTGAAVLALPLVKNLQDCINLDKTALQYLPLLYDLPYRVLASASSLPELTKLYLSTNPLVTACALSLALAPIFLLVSEINKNYSQVDRCWSILPSVYIAHYTAWEHLNGLPTTKLDTLMAISAIWSARLTFNYWRKGGYSIGSEDYRWEILRDYIPPALFFVFNVLFIALAQSILLFMVTTPAYILLLTSQVTDDTLSTGDMAFAGGMVALVVVSAIADQQQWDYQETKKEYRASAKVPRSSPYTSISLDRGFNTHGLWAWSRHPNFAAEQGVWVALFQWSCFETYSFWNWSGFGALAYLLLFQASTWFTELVTRRKYEEYTEYQRLVSRFLPKLSTAFSEPFGNEKHAGAGEEGTAKGKAKK